MYLLFELLSYFISAFFIGFIVYFLDKMFTFRKKLFTKIKHTYAYNISLFLFIYTIGSILLIFTEIKQGIIYGTTMSITIALLKPKTV